MKLANSATLRGNAVVERVHGVELEGRAGGLVVKDLDDLEWQAEPRPERQRNRSRMLKEMSTGSACTGSTKMKWVGNSSR
jgi:hypothetical protein